jgi:MFS family permease
VSTQEPVSRPGWGTRGFGWLRQLRMDTRPLRTARDFRLLLVSRTVTWLGVQVTTVTLMVQVKQLTGSPLAVGLLGVAELAPLAASGLYGGVLADRLDRRKMAIWCEAGLGLVAALLTVNAALPRPALWPLYAAAAALAALAALQRPSLEAAIPRIVPRDQLTAASALSSVTGNAAFIAGPALGGLLVTGPGPGAGYAFNVATYAASLAFLLRLRPLPARHRPPATQMRPPAAAHGQSAESVQGRAAAGLRGVLPGLRGVLPGLRGVLPGLRYAQRRPDLVGSYLADLAAMVFAFPESLFPFMASEMHAEWALGLMFSATGTGALLASATSAWAGRVRRHGLAIAIAAALWGAGIAGFGLSPGIGFALAFLVLAGAADMMSGIFRDTLWNQTIPDELRGRMAGVELLSYSVGPSAGQIRAGLAARLTSVRVALWSGGLACVAAVGLICLVLPRFAACTSAAASDTPGTGHHARGPARAARGAQEDPHASPVS